MYILLHGLILIIERSGLDPRDSGLTVTACFHILNLFEIYFVFFQKIESQPNRFVQVSSKILLFYKILYIPHFFYNFLFEVLYTNE